MITVVVILLAILAGIVAASLTQGWMAGFAIGSMVFVPFLFLTSVLVARVIGLDDKVRDTQRRQQPQTREHLEQ